MINSVVKTRTMLLLSLGVAIFILALVNLSDRVRQTPLPDDGVTWVDTGNGVVATAVRTGSPADRAGIVRGDLLRFVYFGDNNVYKIDQARDIFFILEEKVGIGNSVTYTIE